MPTILLRAEAGDRPADVLLLEDPEHALRAVALLDEGQQGPELISDHRGLPAFRGRWRGHPVAVQTTGLGAPAVAMVVEELLMTGARRFVRAAPALAVSPSRQAGEAVVASSASALDGTSRTYMGDLTLAPSADVGLTSALVQIAGAASVRVVVGGVATVDVLPDADGRKELAAWGILAADLGSAPLFLLAARADTRARSIDARICAGAILWITDRAAAANDEIDPVLGIALHALAGRRRDAR